MPLALIVSSFVAGSRVGGFAQSLALAALGVDPVLAPTVTFGRHPGWGAPGGAAMSADVLRGVLEGIEAQGLLGLADVILTGYFASAEQVEVAADAIDRARAADRSGAATPSLRVIVDPILGDDPGGLYVKPEVEAAIVSHLLPRADLLAPNRWELERLSGTPVTDAATALAAARSLGAPVLASSIPVGADRLGVLYADADQAWLATHGKAVAAPHGTGDLLTALFAAALIEGLPPPTVLTRAVAGVVDAVDAALAWNAPELPLVALGAKLKNPRASVQLQVL